MPLLFKIDPEDILKFKWLAGVGCYQAKSLLLTNELLYCIDMIIIISRQQ